METLGALLQKIISLLMALVLAVASFFSAHVAVAPAPGAPVQEATTTSTFPKAEPNPAEQNALVEAKPTRGPFVKQGLAESQKTATPPSPSEAQPPTKSPEQVNADTRAAVVNIFCTTSAGGYLKPISGSGVLIDSRGVVLTNAHVAQYFLLEDYPFQNNVDCTVRTGNPAVPAYRATLLYLPAAWIEANAREIVSEQAMGTGEKDYAFLLLTSTTNGSALPDLSVGGLPRVPISTNQTDTGVQVLLASYPAGFLDGFNILKNLYMTSAYTSVGQLYSFDNKNFVDLFAVSGTVVSQAGASGGAVARLSDGALLGIISTDTNATTTAARSLFAVSTHYINRDLGGQGGILGLLSGDLDAKALVFNATVAPLERQQLINVLERR